MLLKGRIRSGQGNFSYWMKRLEKFYSEKTGARLYPGTLNILLEGSFYEFPQNTIRLEKEEYGGVVSVAILPCHFLGKLVFALRPDSHGGDYGFPKEAILEIASEIRLRDEFNLSDGDLVEIEVPDEGVVRVP